MYAITPIIIFNQKKNYVLYGCIVKPVFGQEKKLQ